MAGDDNIPEPTHGRERLLQDEIEELRQQLRHRDDAQAQYDRRFTMVVSMSCDVRSGGVESNWSTRIADTPERQAEREREIQRRQDEVVAKHKAVEKALELLEAKVGSDALGKIANGGAYPIRSRYWDAVIYYVPKDPNQRVNVMCNGTPVMTSCLITTEYDLPWPDVMLQRITAIEMDESIVVETGVVQKKASQSWIDRRIRRLRRLLP